MELSVIIPTFGRPERVAACVQALAGQSVESCAYEVLVGIDGGAEAAVEAEAVEAALRRVWPVKHTDRLTVVRCARSGQAAVRNVLLEHARGNTLLFLNDDMLPAGDLLEKHLCAQRSAVGSGAPALVVGASPWVVPEEDTLFDRLIRETSMVFFYDRMDAALARGEVGADHDWGFRHAWLLNLSAPAGLVREAGGLTVFPSTYGYEDDELAFRCRARFGTRVLYEPRAVAHHDHRLTPGSYLEREHRLGFSAWGFAGTTPECAAEMFGRDIRSEAEVGYSREFVEREAKNAERLREVFLELGGVPSDAVPAAGHPASETLMQAIAQQHLLLKRWTWRAGLMEAALAESGVGAAV